MIKNMLPKQNSGEKQMRYRFSRLTLFLATIVGINSGSTIKPTEFRSPQYISNGPLRSIFEEPAESFSGRWWSAVFAKFAQKAFNHKHGRNFEELPALIFNESEFRIAHAFPNGVVPTETQNYNPLLRTTKLRLRADYSEVGAVIGARWDYPIYQGQGRFGVRGSVPLKRCKFDKWDNEGSRDGGQLQDVLAIQPASGVDTDNTTSVISSATSVAIRLDFLESLRQSNELNSFMNYNNDPKSNVVTAGSSVVSTNNLNNVTTDVTTSPNVENVSRSQFGMIYSPEGIVPRPEKEVGVVLNLIKDYKATTKTPTIFSALDVRAKATKGTNYMFDSNLDYSQLADSNQSKGLERIIEDQNNKATIWAIPFFSSDGKKVIGTEPGGIMQVAKQLSEQVTENVYEWLHDRGMDFESYTVDHLGDLEAEVFYEFAMRDNFLIEASGGMVFPTGGKRKYNKNPYQISPGNGGHYEVFVGGKVAVKPGKLISFKADGRYSFVLNETEERSGIFEGSRIKNIGPKANADVKWEYFVGHLDLNISHPGTPSITGLVGYELYYKREDQIKYAKTKMATWLGQTRTSTGAWTANEQTLDNKLAAAHTNSIAHRLRLEASYILSDWLEFFWGSSWTVAGRNTPYAFDGHTGFNVAF
jgi:hypothetical protein